MIEQWRPVVGYEGLYEISNTGRVKSVERDIPYQFKGWWDGQIHHMTHHVKEKIIKPGIRKNDGYVDVPLSKNGSTTVHCVHRLIAEAWIYNPDPKRLTYVNHKDTNPSNNSIDNLEWTTPRQNNIHNVQHFRHSQSIPVYCEETGLVYASMSEADRQLQLPQGRTSDVIKGHRTCNYHLRLATDEEVQKSKLDSCDNDMLTYKQYE